MRLRVARADERAADAARPPGGWRAPAGTVFTTHTPVPAGIDRFPRDEMRPGDVFILNDPYRGGTHLPDITLITPIFVDDEIVMFECALDDRLDLPQVEGLHQVIERAAT